MPLAVLSSVSSTQVWHFSSQLLMQPKSPHDVAWLLHVPWPGRLHSARSPLRSFSEHVPELHENRVLDPGVMMSFLHLP